MSKILRSKTKLLPVQRARSVVYLQLFFWTEGSTVWTLLSDIFFSQCISAFYILHFIFPISIKIPLPCFSRSRIAAASRNLSKFTIFVSVSFLFLYIVSFASHQLDVPISWYKYNRICIGCLTNGRVLSIFVFHPYLCPHDRGPIEEMLVMVVRRERDGQACQDTPE